MPDGPNIINVMDHLKDKVDEWIINVASVQPERYPSLQHAEQAFKDWLWGTSHG